MLASMWRTRSIANTNARTQALQDSTNNLDRSRSPLCKASTSVCDCPICYPKNKTALEKQDAALLKEMNRKDNTKNSRSSPFLEMICRNGHPERTPSKTCPYCPVNGVPWSERPCSPFRTVNLHIPRCHQYGDCDICLSKVVLDWQRDNDPKKTDQTKSSPVPELIDTTSPTETRQRRNINLTRRQAESIRILLETSPIPGVSATNGALERIQSQLDTPLPARSPNKTTDDKPKTPEKSPQRSKPSSPSKTPKTLSPLALPFRPRPVLSGSPKEADHRTEDSDEISKAIRNICSKF
jgi:hypothetical protein